MADIKQTIAEARQLLSAGQAPKARALLLKQAQKDPKNADIAGMLGFAFLQERDLDRAMYYARRACDLAPAESAHVVNLGNLQAISGNPQTAIDTYRRAMQINPRNLRARVSLAATLHATEHFAQAIAEYQQLPAGAQLDPDHALTYAAALQLVGRADQAAMVLEDAIARNPNHLPLAARLAYTLLYCHGVEPARVTAAHVRHGALLDQAFRESKLSSLPSAHTKADFDPDRRLRVGMLSGDMRSHAVMWFTKGLLQHHDKSRMSITMYHSGRTEDGETESVRHHCAAWHRCNNLGPREVASLIAQDKIDVLIDVCGLTQHNRLAAFLFRPAPVQAHWQCHPSTLGMTTIEYRMVDSITDPASMAALSTEKLVSLDPCFVQFTPVDGAPDIAPLPAAAAGHVTFCCFNGIQKFNLPTMRLWARILAGVPGSKLMLKHAALEKPDARADVLARFESAGIPADRIILDPPVTSARDMLPAYNRVDISLDTMPYSGMTTTCESLFMGVPVITREGAISGARVTESLLRAALGADAANFIGADDDAYVRIAVELGNDRTRLAALRSSLRQRFLNSPVGNATDFAARFEHAVRAMWRTRCAAAS
jgi:protein O-GlcNAc transferase